MRITNQMTTNRMLLNMNRNERKIDSYYNQWATGKKIQNPSDNPIVASRALKFRTNVAQTEQYIRNVSQATSWMECSEQSFKNISDRIESLREICDRASSDTFELSDRQDFVNDVKGIFEQIGVEMNATYGGRYVFSGYRTDKPPIIITDDPDADYTIKQSLKPSNIEDGRNFYYNDEEKLDLIDVSKLKLPYSDLKNITIKTSATTSVQVQEVSRDDEDAYVVGDGEIKYIKETGELILGKNVVTQMRENPNFDYEVQYDKKGLKKGDLNPEIYFNCTNNAVNPPKNYYIDGAKDADGDLVSQKIEYEFGINTRIEINSLAKDSYPAAFYADMKVLVEQISSIQITEESEVRNKFIAEGFEGEKLEDEIKNFMENEEKVYREFMQNSFSNMLELVDKHNKEISKEYSALGSKLNRMETIGNRLKEDRINYHTLMSDNEDVDYKELSLNLMSAKYVYESSLKAGGSIMQISLVDFIR